MYENELPNEGDLVMVKIIGVDDEGAKCELLEYGGTLGYLPCTEYSRKHIRSIKKLIKPGKRDVLSVLRVDTQKKYIDLSKKHVTPTEYQQTESKFQKSSFVHSLITQLSNTHHFDVPQVYHMFGYPLYTDFGHAFDGLEQASRDITLLQKYNIESNILSDLLTTLAFKFQDKEKTLRNTIIVSCIGVEGINAVKHTLQHAQSLFPNINISVLRCPEYTLSCTSVNVNEMQSSIHKIHGCIKDKIETYDGGIFEIKDDTIIIQ